MKLGPGGGSTRACALTGSAPCLESAARARTFAAAKVGRRERFQHHPPCSERFCHSRSPVYSAAGPPPSPQTGLFEWVDEAGVVHYTTDRESVPDRYRSTMRLLSPDRGTRETALAGAPARRARPEIPPFVESAAPRAGRSGPPPGVRSAPTATRRAREVSAQRARAIADLETAIKQDREALKDFNQPAELGRDGARNGSPAARARRTPGQAGVGSGRAARRDSRNRTLGDMPRPVVALAGGVGAARFLEGLVQVVPPEEITAIVNNGRRSRLLRTARLPGPRHRHLHARGDREPRDGLGLPRRHLPMHRRTRALARRYLVCARRPGSGDAHPAQRATARGGNALAHHRRDSGGLRRRGGAPTDDRGARPDPRAEEGRKRERLRGVPGSRRRAGGRARGRPVGGGQSRPRTGTPRGSRGCGDAAHLPEQPRRVDRHHSRRPGGARPPRGPTLRGRDQPHHRRPPRQGPGGPPAPQPGCRGLGSGGGGALSHARERHRDRSDRRRART